MVKKMNNIPQNNLSVLQQASPALPIPLSSNQHDLKMQQEIYQHPIIEDSQMINENNENINQDFFTIQILHTDLVGQLEDISQCQKLQTNLLLRKIDRVEKESQTKQKQRETIDFLRCSISLCNKVMELTHKTHKTREKPIHKKRERRTNDQIQSKPFKCLIYKCSKAFVAKAPLKKHLKSKHGICNKTIDIDSKNNLQWTFKKIEYSQHQGCKCIYQKKLFIKQQKTKLKKLDEKQLDTNNVLKAIQNQSKKTDDKAGAKQINQMISQGINQVAGPYLQSAPYRRRTNFNFTSIFQSSVQNENMSNHL